MAVSFTEVESQASASCITHTCLVGNASSSPFYAICVFNSNPSILTFIKWPSNASELAQWCERKDVLGISRLCIVAINQILNSTSN